MTDTGFTNLDYAILFAYLIATVLFGMLIGRGQKNTGDYFLGGKRLPWWAICGSIVATETSTLTFIGIPALAYAGNMVFLQVAIGYVIGRILVSIFLIPAYFRGELQTAYQLLRTRFGQGARTLAATLFLVTRSLADGVRLFATGLVLSEITGLSDMWAVALIGIFTVIYTYYGGIVSVVWNDVIQLLVYLAGASIAFYILVTQIPGGWAGIVSTAGPLGKFQIFDLGLSLNVPYTFWAGLVGGAFLTFATHGTDQMMVQRYLACGDKRSSQMALIVSGIIVLSQFALFLVIGVMLFVFYQHFPLGRELTQTDRIFPIFIIEEIPPGITGIIIAAIFAAAMSTLSSSLNSLASSSVNDFYRTYFSRGASESHYLNVSRLLTLIWGAVLTGISMLARNVTSVLEAGLTIASVTMGSLLGVFLLGIWTRRTDQRSAVIGMLAGIAAMLAVHFSGAVAWTWYTLIGTTVTFTVGLLSRRLAPGTPASA